MHRKPVPTYTWLYQWATILKAVPSSCPRMSFLLLEAAAAARAAWTACTLIRVYACNPCVTLHGSKLLANCTKRNGKAPLWAVHRRVLAKRLQKDVHGCNTEGTCAFSRAHITPTSVPYIILQHWQSLASLHTNPVLHLQWGKGKTQCKKEERQIWGLNLCYLPTSTPQALSVPYLSVSASPPNSSLVWAAAIFTLLGWEGVTLLLRLGWWTSYPPSPPLRLDRRFPKAGFSSRAHPPLDNVTLHWKPE